MSSVVIGGSGLKHSVDLAETASLSMTDAQRTSLVAVFAQCKQKIDDFVAAPYPPA